MRLVEVEIRDENHDFLNQLSQKLNQHLIYKNIYNFFINDIFIYLNLEYPPHKT